MTLIYITCILESSPIDSVMVNFPELELEDEDEVVGEHAYLEKYSTFFLQNSILFIFYFSTKKKITHPLPIQLKAPPLS